MKRAGPFAFGIFTSLAVTLLSVAGGLAVLLLAFIGLITGLALTKHKKVAQDFSRARTLNEMLLAAREITHRSQVLAAARPVFSGNLERLCLGAISGFLGAVLINDFPWFADNYEVAK